MNFYEYNQLNQGKKFLKGGIHVKISKNRTARKQQQIEENQFFEDSEGLLYGPGIAD